MQLFTRKAAQLLYTNQRLQRWCFDVELLFLAQNLEVPVVEASVNWTEIPGGPSLRYSVRCHMISHEQDIGARYALQWLHPHLCEYA